MKQLTLPQGSDLWHAHRAKSRNASEAAAALGLSPHMTRGDLIAALATGIRPEHSSFVEDRILASGHRIEALMKPIAEKIIGEPLYAMVGVSDDDYLSASFDGITMAEDIAWECKRLNNDLFTLFKGVLNIAPEKAGAQLPIHHQIQMEQQLAVSGAEKVLFTAGDFDAEGNPTDYVYCWYYPNLELRAKILGAWGQVDKDVVVYVPEAKAERVVAEVVERLPMVLDLRVEGKLVSCNIEKFKPAALAYIEAINTKLTTDTHFATAFDHAKYCRESAKKLLGVVENAIGQMGDINTVIQAVREIAEAFDAKGLSLEKLVDKRKAEIKLEIHSEFTKKLADHIAELNAALGKAYMPAAIGDWAGVMKNKRTVDSLREACSTELAECKIAADEQFRRIQTNLTALREKAVDHKFLFEDTAQLVLKPCEDVATIIDARIGKFKADEAEKKRKADAEAEAKRVREAEAAAQRQRDAEAQAQRERDEKERQTREAPQTALEATRAQPGQPILGAENLPRDTPFKASVGNVAPLRSQGNPTLTMKRIHDALDLPITAAFIEQTLGIAPAKRERSAIFFYEGDFESIKAALVRHVQAAQLEQLQAA